MGVQSSLVKKRVRNGRTRWIIDFYFIDKTGARARFVRFAALQTREGAEREARQLYERATLTGSPDVEAEPRKPVLTLGAFYEDTFKPVFLPKYRPNTRTRYEALWRQRVRAAFGATPLADIDAAAIVRFAAGIEGQGRQAKGPVRFVQTLLNTAVVLNLLPEIPKLPKGIVKEPKKLPAAPSVELVERILAHATGWSRLAIALGVYAGLRSGEIRALEAGDVDLAREILRVQRTLSEHDPMQPKGLKERVVGIAPALAPILREALGKKGPTSRLVVTATGATPTRQAVLTAVVAVQRRMGVPRPWSVHALRHAFCSQLVRAGVGVEIVRALAGHSSIAVTNRYVHAEGAELRAAVTRAFGVVTTR